MAHNRIHLSLTSDEREYFESKASDKSKSIYILLHEEILKSFNRIDVDGACGEVIIKAKRTDHTIDVSPDTMRAIRCAAARLSITPSTLVYRIVVAPKLQEIMKKTLNK